MNKHKILGIVVVLAAVTCASAGAMFLTPAAPEHGSQDFTTEDTTTETSVIPAPFAGYLNRLGFIVIPAVITLYSLSPGYQVVFVNATGNVVPVANSVARIATFYGGFELNMSIQPGFAYHDDVLNRVVYTEGPDFTCRIAFYELKGIYY